MERESEAIVKREPTDEPMREMANSFQKRRLNDGSIGPAGGYSSRASPRVESFEQDSEPENLRKPLDDAEVS